LVTRFLGGFPTRVVVASTGGGVLGFSLGPQPAIMPIKTQRQTTRFVIGGFWFRGQRERKKGELDEESRCPGWFLPSGLDQGRGVVRRGG